MSAFKSIKNPALFYFGFLLLGLVADNFLDSFIQLQIIYILINMILAMGLNLVNGFTGQFSLGHAGFMAVGAYFSAWLSKQGFHLPGSLDVFSYLIYAVMGGCAAALAGLLVGMPSLRLRGDYLAIVTLGFGEIIRVVLLNMPAVGGATGFIGIPSPGSLEIGNLKFSSFFISYSQSLFWAIVTFTVIWRLVRSRHGRFFMSVREDEVAAEAMGVDTTNTKIRAFALSSFFAGIAGSLFAHYAGFLTPATFSFNKSVDVVIMVVLGGMGSLSGSVIAAAVISVLPEILRPLKEWTGVDLRMVIYSMCLILMMILRPKGLFGNKELNFFNRWLTKRTNTNPPASAAR